MRGSRRDPRERGVFTFNNRLFRAPMDAYIYISLCHTVGSQQTSRCYLCRKTKHFQFRELKNLVRSEYTRTTYLIVSRIPHRRVSAGTFIKRETQNIIFESPVMMARRCLNSPAL